MKIFKRKYFNCWKEKNCFDLKKSVEQKDFEKFEYKMKSMISEAVNDMKEKGRSFFSIFIYLFIMNNRKTKNNSS